jgi:hypothetical protein
MTLEILLDLSGFFETVAFTYTVYLYPYNSAKNRARFRFMLIRFLWRHEKDCVSYHDAMKIAKTIRRRARMSGEQRIDE